MGKTAIGFYVWFFFEIFERSGSESCIHMFLVICRVSICVMVVVFERNRAEMNELTVRKSAVHLFVFDIEDLFTTDSVKEHKQCINLISPICNWLRERA